ncbi:MAG TPA: bifunctional helix-turn-helix transcriptional regulator/GNAT family N-acetyltransferase [Eudoraea sp.]|nr:bifunctional helix-turn-helix transcriptional regulator/GNAT family N-acetyltransferase [Eudoraea sp.]
MADKIEEIGYLAGGSRLRRIYEKLQVGGDKVYKEAGISFKSSWFPVYYVLAKSIQPQTIMEITHQIAFSHITVKNILCALERESLIQMGPNPRDKRSKLVALSGKGKYLLTKLEPLWASFDIALRGVFTIGHPEMNGILSRIDAALNDVPLNDRVRNLQDRAYEVRNAKPEEFDTVGALMVRVYSQLDGFPKAAEQPEYYDMLAHIGKLTEKPATELLVAVNPKGIIGGAVVYFSDMQYYGSGGTATLEKNSSGFRLLAVDQFARGQGLGKLLTVECVRRAKLNGSTQVVIHSTKAMQIAWKMYENMGFKRSDDLDFKQGDLRVFGFRLKL